LLALKAIEAAKTDDALFDEEYCKLLIVNPTKNKFKETVMDVTHYELLRMYSGELEKENSILFVIGFSMEDEHIREITKRVADSNPTLKIYIFCYSNGKTKANCEQWFNGRKYQNIEIVYPPGGKAYDVVTINNDYFANILDYKEPDDKAKDGEQQEV
jgi:hypothetical protein